MKRKVSRRGRFVVKAVRMSTTLPVIGPHIQDGTLRRKMQERQAQWKCPAHLELVSIPQMNYNMEWLCVKKDKAIEKKENFPYAGECVILQLHGGGYVGSLYNKHRDMAGLYLEVSGGFSVLSVDYRVAPEHPFPAALEDAYSAYEWLLEQGYSAERIFLCGDSAGGGLALSLCMYLRDRKKDMPAGIVTMSAWTDLTKSGESYEENYECDPLFGRSKDTLIYRPDYYEQDRADNPYVSPLLGDFAGFPPMLMQVGEYEMLLSDTLRAAKKAQEQGVEVTCHVYPGMFHVFQYGELLYPEAKEAWVEAGHFLRDCYKREKGEDGRRHESRQQGT